MVTNDRIGARGIVVGAGMAGLSAAAAMAPFFQAIEIFERDVLPGRAQPRKGVPQDRQVHILLKGGELALEELLPGIAREFRAAGAVEVRQSEDASTWEHDAWHPARALGYSQLLLSRPAYEQVLRARVLRLGNVTLRDGEALDGLPGDSADLVVVATGRGDRLLSALDVPTSRLGIEVTYVSARFAKPPRFRGERRFLACIPEPPDDRYGLVCPVENDEWLITLCSRFDNRVPLEPDGFRAYARSLPVPEIAERLKEATQLSDIRSYRIAEAVWRHFEQVPERLPPRVLPIGDCISNFNPTFGQGMSVAARHAVALRDALGAVGSEPARLAPAYLAAAAEVSQQAWNVAALADLLYPRTTGARPAGLDRMRLASEALRRAAQAHEEVQRLRFEIGNLVKPDSALRSGRAARLVALEMARAGGRGRD